MLGCGVIPLGTALHLVLLRILQGVSAVLCGLHGMLRNNTFITAVDYFAMALLFLKHSLIHSYAPSAFDSQLIMEPVSFPRL